MISTVPVYDSVIHYQRDLGTLSAREFIDVVRFHAEDGVYFVEGEWLLKLISTVNFDDYESLQYFQRVLINTGVIDALREAGIQEGDTVSMYDLEFDFVE